MTVISISGLPCCGSTTIGTLLSEKLKLKFFSIGKKYKEHGQGRNETEKAINFLATKEGAEKGMHESLDDMQIRLAKEGNIVIDSKLAVYFLRDLADLKVWLYAPFDVRVQRVAKREGCDTEKAKKMLEEKEKLEKELFRKVYNIDYLEQKQQADIAIDVSSLTPENIVDKILDTLKLK